MAWLQPVQIRLHTSALDILKKGAQAMDAAISS